MLDTPPGLLDYPVDVLRAQNRFTKELKKLNRDVKSFGRKLKWQRRWMDLLSFSPRLRRWVGNWSARSIGRSASYVEKRLALFKALVKDIQRNTQGFIESADAGAIELDILKKFRDVIDAAVTTTAETLAAVTGYRVTIEETEALNLSRTIRIACGRLAQAMRGIETVFRAHQKAQAGLLRDAERKLEQVARHESAE